MGRSKFCYNQEMDFNLLIFVIFIFGLIIGSFLNSVIYRLNNNKSFLRGRSFCPACEHKLNWTDLIPIFSFLILKGRCCYCKKPIALQYPIVEFVTGFLLAIIFWQTQPIQNFQSVIHFIYLSIVSCLLIKILNAVFNFLYHRIDQRKKNIAHILIFALQ